MSGRGSPPGGSSRERSSRSSIGCEPFSPSRRSYQPPPPPPPEDPDEESEDEDESQLLDPPSLSVDECPELRETAGIAAAIPPAAAVQVPLAPAPPDRPPPRPPHRSGPG